MAPGFFAKLARSRHSSESSPPPAAPSERARAITLTGSTTSSGNSSVSGHGRRSGSTGSEAYFRHGRRSSSSEQGHHQVPKVEVTPALTNSNGIHARSSLSTRSARSSVTSPEVTVVPPSPQSVLGSIPPEDTASVAEGGRTGTGADKRRPERLTSLSGDSDDLRTPRPGEVDRVSFIDTPTRWQSSPENSPASADPNTPSTATAVSVSAGTHVLANGSVPVSGSAQPSSIARDRPMAASSKPNGNGNGAAQGDYDNDPTPPPVVHGRAATYAGGVDPSLLAPSGKRDADSVSLASTASRRRGLFKRPSFTNLPATSPKRKPTGLASAIASSGLAMANPALGGTPPVLPLPDGWRPRSSGKDGPPSPSASRTTNARANRSPALYGAMDGSDSQLTTSPRSRSNSLSIPPGDRDDFASNESDDEGEMDEDDAQLLADIGADDIPVTGFAVASNKRNADFHDLFPTIPEGDYLIEDYGCALQRDILIQGRLYISEHHICFHANIFGWVTDVIIPIYEIASLEKKMTAFVIPNAICITTRTAKYTFASFLARDTVYDVIDNIRKLERSDAESGDELDVVLTGPMTPAGVAATVAAGAAVPAHKATQCACGRESKHYSDLALEAVYPGTPESIYNLLFASGFMKDFMREELKLEDLQISDWTPSSGEPKCLARNMSYIKPLNGSIGPRQTKCEIRDEVIYSDFNDYVVTITTTRTPDVPSGNVFAVKTRTCIMWASPVAARVVVTTQVEWTGRSFIKGIIERSCIEGQKTQYADLDKAMRAYINEHKTEFLPAGIDPEIVEVQTPPASTPAELAKHEGTASPAELAEARERERNARGMQWAYDTFAGARDVALRSTTGALELVREAWEQSTSTTILWFVIVFLVASNLWTLSRMGSREEAGRRKELRKLASQERWVQNMVGALWDEVHAAAAREREHERTAHTHGHEHAPVPQPIRSDGQIDVQTEVAALVSALDAVEERVRSLRRSLSLDALD